jgi:asparagine synthetase B (glutamine-hydrolysing)
MCGIHLVVELSSRIERNDNDIPSWLVQRGPDHCARRVLQSTNAQGNDLTVTLQASVLRMREHLIPQPVQINTDTDVFLAWNGEVYQIQNDKGEIEDVWAYQQSDTEVIAKLVRDAIQQSENDDKDTTNKNTNTNTNNNLLIRLAGMLSTLVNAEFAFCLLTAEAVYYARDSFGRRSLLVHEKAAPSVTVTGEQGDGTDTDTDTDTVHSSSHPLVWQLSSVASGNNNCDNNNAFIYKEVEPGRVFSYNFQSGETESMPWQASQLPMIPMPPLTVSESLTSFGSNPSSGMNIEQASLQLQDLLFKAVQRRLTGPAAVLFSGGLDSVVLAALALQVIQSQQSQSPALDETPLTLINISFVEDRTAANNPVSADTQAAMASYQDLLQIYPDRKIRFCQVQAEWSEIQAQEQHIQQLIHPKSTTMDVNIATALWFAANANANASAAACASDNDSDNANGADTIDARILLTGLGADEQMGGYGRHRKAWERGKSEELRQELDLDMGRLWDRNLGRDDRVLSDSSKEARFPFLDPGVVQFLQNQPFENVVDYSLPAGEGDKRILRLVAARLGLPAASTAVKRAIQFGSRIAHVSDKQRFGSRRKATGVKVASYPKSKS